MTQETILTVSELTEAIKQNLETAFPAISLQGEISNCKRHSSGHIYFSMKDASAQISAVMFRGYAKSLERVPKDGDQVVIKGHMNVYPPSGRYQIVAYEMQMAGVGQLLLKLEELKKKIHQKGWFSSEHKKPLPKFPKTIGVITSPTGAAVQDILHILSRRFRGLHVVIYPVRVQGEGAAAEIQKAIEEMNAHKVADVLIIGRGGGSIEDLWAFNEERVAEAVFLSEIPIICAVGHETDHSIAEYVADVRAPTPSAAAEIVIGELSSHLDFLKQTDKRLFTALNHTIQKARHQLAGAYRHPLIASPYSLLGPWMQKLDDLKCRIDTSTLSYLENKKLRLQSQKQLMKSLNPVANILTMKHELQSFNRQLSQVFGHYLQIRKQNLTHLHSQLITIDPKNLLKKGYSLSFSKKDNSVITSVNKLTKNQQLRLLFFDGEVTATVDEIMSNDKN
ncbi:MAG: exodeoxyribonuclease VII large subunit [Waddliaceae bacterium]